MRCTARSGAPPAEEECGSDASPHASGLHDLLSLPPCAWPRSRPRQELDAKLAGVAQTARARRVSVSIAPAEPAALARPVARAAVNHLQPRRRQCSTDGRASPCACVRSDPGATEWRPALSHSRIAALSCRSTAFTRIRKRAAGSHRGQSASLGVLEREADRHRPLDCASRSLGVRELDSGQREELFEERHRRIGRLLAGPRPAEQHLRPAGRKPLRHRRSNSASPAAPGSNTTRGTPDISRLSSMVPWRARSRSPSGRSHAYGRDARRYVTEGPGLSAYALSNRTVYRNVCDDCPRRGAGDGLLRSARPEAEGTPRERLRAVVGTAPR